MDKICFHLVIYKVIIEGRKEVVEKNTLPSKDIKEKLFDELNMVDSPSIKIFYFTLLLYRFTDNDILKNKLIKEFKAEFELYNKVQYLNTNDSQKIPIYQDMERESGGYRVVRNTPLLDALDLTNKDLDENKKFLWGNKNYFNDLEDINC